ncbi:hypothetical protein ACFL35_05700 [Candidatus Riflebacteria bacterium]
MQQRDKKSLFPTREHENAAVFVMDFFSKQACVEAVLLTCSCARGKAVPESCVDLSIILAGGTGQCIREQLELSWGKHSEGNVVVKELAAHGKYAHIDLELTEGEFSEGYHGWCSGPDEFELEIGNLLQYSVTMYERSDRLNYLKEKWLPYYPSKLRQRRLAMVQRYCLNNIDHVAPFVRRELYFQAFRRLYNAVGEFLQALFIANHTYPIAYDKWIREQLVDILKMPELYTQIVAILTMKKFESMEMKEKADTLHDLYRKYCCENKNP